MAEVQRRVLRRLTLGAVLAAAILVGGCAPWQVDEADARRAATDWVALQALPGETMQNVTVSSVRQEGGGWVVEVTGEPRGAGQPEGMTYYYLLFVDGVTGAVTVRALG